MIYLQLFYEFFKTGLFAVGGGLATLPFLYNLSDKTGWFTYCLLYTSAADRRLVDIDNLVKILDTVDPVMLARVLARAV